jgi:fructokinase
VDVGVFGGVEGGGTKFVCGIGTGPQDLKLCTFGTTSPGDTVQRVCAFFRDAAGKELDAVGIGSFGPVDLHRESQTFGYITSTPKLGWQHFDLAGTIGRTLDVPVGFDTDVNAAALGEACWGEGVGLQDFVYLTVGTGIGGGVIVHGDVLHGLVHPEMGHIRIPHDLKRDPYPGSCPYHGDCLEGLASGPAMEKRWGIPASMLGDDHPAWELEAHYLALGLATWVCTLSPQKFIVGGGVMQQEHLFPLVRAELSRLLNGYIQSEELLTRIDQFVVPPRLGSDSGVLGSFVLAERAFRNSKLRSAPAKVEEGKYAT